MKSFRNLKIWEKSHGSVLEIYRITRTFPSEEKFGLVSQIRRSASSIPTNIVEGSKRRSDKEYSYFLNLAEASLEETKYHLVLSKDLEYISEKSFVDLHAKCEEIGKMLCGFQKRLTA